MRLDPYSVQAGYRAAMQRMLSELAEFKQQAALDYFELRRELDQALEQVRTTRLEFLTYQQAVVHDRARLAEINRLRDIVKAECAQLDATTKLQ